MEKEYWDIEYFHNDEESVSLRICAHFFTIMPEMAIKCEIWGDAPDKPLNGFISQSSNRHSVTLDKRLPPPDAPGRNLRVKAALFWLDNDGVLRVNLLERPLARSDGEAVPVAVSVTKPRAANKTITYACYSRTGGDYDYLGNVKTDSKFKVLLPFEGSVTLQSGDWRVVEIADGSVPEFQAPVLNLLLSTGGCTTYNRPILPQFTVEDGRVSWAFDDDWNDSFDCGKIGPSTMMRFYCKFYLRLQSLAQPELYKYEPVIISSEKGEKPPTARIERINILYGCMAEDTMILMTDGREKPIQSIREYEQICTGAGTGEVVFVSIGTEDALIHIETQNGRFIDLTDGHPVLTARGFVRADELVASDQLILQNGGESPISALYRTGCAARVYNLFLRQSGTTLYANGFAVGDMAMQNTLEAKRSEPPEDSYAVAGGRKAFAELMSLARDAGIEQLRDAVETLNRSN